MCTSGTEGQQRGRPSIVRVRNIVAGSTVAVVERGRGQPGIGGLANLGVQPTAARVYDERRCG
jgi:hypothetical protein